MRAGEFGTLARGFPCRRRGFIIAAFKVVSDTIGGIKNRVLRIFRAEPEHQIDIGACLLWLEIVGITDTAPALGRGEIWIQLDGFGEGERCFVSMMVDHMHITQRHMRPGVLVIQRQCLSS